MKKQTSRQGERNIGYTGQHYEKNYTAFNHLLDIVRDSFLLLHKSFANEERWRWDTPMITFTWGNGQVQRNLNGFVLGEEQPTGIEVESNAWVDVRKGKSLIRYWHHFPAGRIDYDISFTKESVSRVKDDYPQKTVLDQAKDVQEKESFGNKEVYLKEQVSELVKDAYAMVASWDKDKDEYVKKTIINSSE